MTAGWEVTQEEQRERRLRMRIDGVPTLEHLRRLLLTAQDAGFSPTAELLVAMWTADKSELILIEQTGTTDVSPEETTADKSRVPAAVLDAGDGRAAAFSRGFLR